MQITEIEIIANIRYVSSDVDTTKNSFA